MIPLCTQRKKW